MLASANPGKAREIIQILSEAWAAGPRGGGGEPIVIHPRPPDVSEVVEDGTTLEDNARLKARALCAATGLAAVADDTGLEVDALDGAPGVHSARFAGDAAGDAARFAGDAARFAGDAANVALLLDELASAGATDARARTARFRTVALVVFPDGSEVKAQGVVEGVIAPEARGEGGFGYDPVFVPGEGDGRTFAQMEAADKHAVSHRGRALRALATTLADRSPGDEPGAGTLARVRRRPPPFREAAVVGVERRSPHLTRVVCEADGLAAMVGNRPAASVRLLLPDATGLVTIPTWVGNEFLAADGIRPAIRTLTPLQVPGHDDALALDVVIHGGGLLSAWASTVVPGQRVGLSGPGRGTDLAPEAHRWLLAGDESAMPAIATILEALVPEATAEVVVEVRRSRRRHHPPGSSGSHRPLGSRGRRGSCGFGHGGSRDHGAGWIRSRPRSSLGVGRRRGGGGATCPPGGGPGGDPPGPHGHPRLLEGGQGPPRLIMRRVTGVPQRLGPARHEERAQRAVRAGGLEPPRVAPQGPKPCASASSATPAGVHGGLRRYLAARRARTRPEETWPGTGGAGPRDPGLPAAELSWLWEVVAKTVRLGSIMGHDPGSAPRASPGDAQNLPGKAGGRWCVPGPLACTFPDRLCGPVRPTRGAP